MKNVKSLSEVIAASEQDINESAEITIDSRGKYQLTVECSSLVRSRMAFRSSAKYIPPRTLTRQMELLNGRWATGIRKYRITNSSVKIHAGNNLYIVCFNLVGRCFSGFCIRFTFFSVSMFLYPSPLGRLLVYLLVFRRFNGQTYVFHHAVGAGGVTVALSVRGFVAPIPNVDARLCHLCTRGLPIVAVLAMTTFIPVNPVIPSVTASLIGRLRILTAGIIAQV